LAATDGAPPNAQASTTKTLNRKLDADRFADPPLEV